MKAGSAQVVRFDEKGLAVGSGWTQRSIRWHEATEYTKADIRFLSGWLPDSSYSVLQSEEEVCQLDRVSSTIGWATVVRINLKES